MNLHLAAEQNSVGELEKLLSLPDINLDSLDKAGHTPLYRASARNAVYAVQTLIQHGASLNLAGRDTQTPLQMAVLRNKMGAGRLLASAGACIDPEYEAEHANELRLWTAVLRGDLDELRRRIDAGDSVDQAPQGGDAKGCTALWLAVALGREDAARILIQSGADVNNSVEYSPLLASLRTKSLNLTHILLNSGANVEVGTDIFPLLTAIRSKVLALASAVIHAGADLDRLNAQNMTQAEFILASLYLDAKPVFDVILRELLSAGATVDGATAEISPLVPSDVIRAIVPEDTPFWLAANNDAPMLSLELAGGLDPNMKTENGMTLLHWACAGDAPECVQLLLDAGADVEALAPSGNSDTTHSLPPLFYTLHHDPACTARLAAAGDTLSTVDHNQSAYMTALHYALALNCYNVVRTLVLAGAPLSSLPPYATPLLAHALAARPTPAKAITTLVAAAPQVLREHARTAGGRVRGAGLAVSLGTVEGLRAVVAGGGDAGIRVQGMSLVEFAEKLRKEAIDKCNDARVKELEDIQLYLRALDHDEGTRCDETSV